MKELSLNILDIAQNSVKSGAANVSITINESSQRLVLTITDDGCGMDGEFLKHVTDPFCTTRTTRKVGLGLPLLKLAAEQTGGTMEISSQSEKEFPDNHGTTVRAEFFTNHIDFTPLGDIASTICVLVHGNPDMDFEFSHVRPCGTVSVSTKEMRQMLGDIPLNNGEVIAWLEEYIRDQYKNE